MENHFGLVAEEGEGPGEDIQLRDDAVLFAQQLGFAFRVVCEDGVD